MTTFDRFDPFSRRISEAMDDIAPARRPDYLDDVLQLTARTSQRPRWSFPERWFNVDTTFPRSAFGGRVPFRTLVVLAVLVALLAASIALYVGTRPRYAPPIGPASNGIVVTAQYDDLYIRDALTGESRLLVGGEGKQIAPEFSPNGQYLSYFTELPDGDHMFIANADGTNAREVALIPLTGNAQGQWAPDSQRAVMIYDIKGSPALSIVTVTGETTFITLPGLVPLHPVWSPTGDRLLIRARIAGTEEIGLFIMNPDGTNQTRLNLPGRSAFGVDWTLSGVAWSPDGKTIAYNSILTDAAVPNGAYYRRNLVNVDGTNIRTLLPVEDSHMFDQAWPVYSPDGKWIAMESWYSHENGLADNQIAIAPADGSAPARNVGPRITGQSLSKVWSPDGTRVIMGTSDSKTLYSIDPISGEAEILPYLAELPAWQRTAR